MNSIAWFTRRATGRAGDWWVNSTEGTLGYVVSDYSEPQRHHSGGTIFWEAFDREGKQVGGTYPTRKRAAEALGARLE